VTDPFLAPSASPGSRRQVSVPIPFRTFKLHAKRDSYFCGHTWPEHALTQKPPVPSIGYLILYALPRKYSGRAFLFFNKNSEK